MTALVNGLLFIGGQILLLLAVLCHVLVTGEDSADLSPEARRLGAALAGLFLALGVVWMAAGCGLFR